MNPYGDSEWPYGAQSGDNFGLRDEAFGEDNEVLARRPTQVRGRRYRKLAFLRYGALLDPRRAQR